MSPVLRPGIRRIRSIAHSIAHHALGGSSRSTPERNLEKRRCGLASICVTLAGEPDDPLRGESSGLRDFFRQFLAKEGIDSSMIATANAHFFYSGQCRLPSSCQVIILLEDGRSVERRVSEP